MQRNLYIRGLIFVILLMFLYRTGIELSTILLIGGVMILLFLLRGKLYEKVDKVMTKTFPSISKFNHSVKKILIVVIFIGIYFILKEMFYFILRMMGFDVEKVILDSINSSLSG